MRGSILKCAAAVVIAVCVGIIFIPLAGEYAFADVNDNGDPANELNVPEAGQTEVTTPDLTPGAGTENPDENVTDPQQDPEDPAAESGNESGEQIAEDPAEEPAVEPVVEPEPVKNGLITENGAKYYYVNGVMKTGVIKIGNDLYYFFKNGKATTATSWFKGDDSSTADRFGLGGGKIFAGAKAFSSKVNYKAKVKKRYKKRGKWRTKYVTVTKTKTVTTLYWFDPNTGRRNHGAGFFDYNGKSYYCKGNGILATGWQALKRDGKLNGYFFNRSNGTMAKGTTVGYLRIPANGKLHEAYALGIQKLNKTGWSLKQAYKNSYKIKYQGRWWRQKSSELYAMKGFKKNKGNCYVMAATFYIQGKLLGYNIRQIHGKVAYRAPHSWTQIHNGKAWRVYDPNFKNETRRNGWNIYYGKKGTWRYTNYSTFQN